MVQFAGPDECWLWTGSSSGTGYGEFVIQGRGGDRPRIRTTAHRCAYRYTYGDLPDGRQVNHTCDNRLCVNPRHLYAGTHEQNMADMANRHRCNPRRLFSEAQILDIRSSTDSQGAIARRYGASQSAISLIRLRRTYRHIP